MDHGELTGLIRRAAGTDTLEPQIERLSTFTFAAQMAERYAEGRCFLAGDAAHRMTPRGGTGMNTAIQDSFDLGWKLAWVLRGWAGPELLATYERDRRPVATHNVQRASEPTGARRETDQALPWDLNGRLPHHWLAGSGGQTSTIDLIGDGLTLLAGPSDPRWARFAESTPSSAPIDVHVVDAATADALDLPPAGALLARPDGGELRRWTDLDAAATGWEGSTLPELLDAESALGAGPPLPVSSQHEGAASPALCPASAVAHRGTLMELYSAQILHRATTSAQARSVRATSSEIRVYRMARNRTDAAMQAPPAATASSRADQVDQARGNLPQPASE